MTTDMTPEQEAQFALLTSMLEPEELHPELKTHLYTDPRLGACLKHPLVFSVVYAECTNKHLNGLFKAKLEGSERARAAKNWDSFVFFHERPYRVDAFMEIEEEMTNKEYWTLLSDIWTDSENIRQSPEEWESLLCSVRRGKQNFMRPEERKALAALPDTLTIYQGHTEVRDDGWSWTTERPTAEWFARRFALLERDDPYLTIGTAKKSDVVGYLTRRGEYEIVVDPSLVVISETLALEDEG